MPTGHIVLHYDVPLYDTGSDITTMFLRFILAQVYRITLLALQVTTSCDGKMMRSQHGIMRSMQVSMSHQSSHIIPDQISA